MPVDEGDGELDMASTASCLISASTVIFLVDGWGEVKKGESWDSQEMIATRRTTKTKRGKKRKGAREEQEAVDRRGVGLGKVKKKVRKVPPRLRGREDDGTG